MRRRRGNKDLPWILAAGLAAAILTPFLVETFGRTEPEAAAVPAVPARTGSTAALPAAAPLGATRQVAPLTVSRPAADLPALTLAPPYEIGDGLTILTEKQRVRIAGLNGPAREAACFDVSGNLWGCGLQARAALNNLIRNKELVCRPTGENAGAAMLANCTVGGLRVDRALVTQGFAQPAFEDPVLARDVSDAKAAGRGLWNGGWRVRE